MKAKINVKRGLSLAVFLLLFHAASFAQELNIRISPNPVGDRFHLTGLVGEARVIVYDMQGKIIVDTHVLDKESVEMKNFRKGIYIVEIQTENGNLSAKLLKK